jgi:hypothetical protein
MEQAKAFAYCTECGAPQGTFSNEGELRMKIAEQRRCPNCGTEFGFYPNGIWNLKVEPLIEKDFSESKYLNIPTLPDSFYVELQEQINKAFKYEIFPAVQILFRKLLENLIIDILRKKYGMTKIELFYDTNKGKFHGFNFLLKVLDERINDFAAISAVFDKEFLKKINEFREQGNSSAHTIELKLDKDRIAKEAKEKEYIINVLIRVFNSL